MRQRSAPGVLLAAAVAAGVAAALALRAGKGRKTAAPDEGHLEARHDALGTLPGDGRPRVLILGGGFGGFYTARHLQRKLREDEVEIVLVSRTNYFLMTPLLFEAGSGTLEFYSAVNSLRPLLPHTRFVDAGVEQIDLERRVVRAHLTTRVAAPLVRETVIEIPFDHLVLALGGVTSAAFIPGAEEHGLFYKALMDAVVLRNQVIAVLERADAEPDPALRRALLRFVVVGGGLVGTELMGELSEFVHKAVRSYPYLRPDEIAFDLIEAGPRILPEIDPPLADYAAGALTKRGVSLRLDTPVQRMEAGRLLLPGGERIEAQTILVATGVKPSPVLDDLPLARDRRGRILTDGAMRADRPGVWALGDCAAIPDPEGRPYPPLAQHALREARVLAGNIAAVLRGRPDDVKPFVYESMGLMASLGHFNGVANVRGVRLRGFPAWLLWRLYYVHQMPQKSKRTRIVADRILSQIFPPDVVKIDLAGEEKSLRRLIDLAADGGSHA